MEVSANANDDDDDIIIKIVRNVTRWRNRYYFIVLCLLHDLRICL